MYIKPIDYSNFLGLDNNVEFSINFSATECTYPMNIRSVQSLRIVISGDIILIFHLDIIIWNLILMVFIKHQI